jgi:acyl carrier protein
MRGSQDKAFKTKLKQLIITECEVQTDLEIDSIDDDVPLFGADSQLGLDSIDGFQMALAVEKTYGIKITDGKEMRRVMTSINTFADFLQPE